MFITKINLPRVVGLMVGFAILTCVSACGNETQDRPAVSVTSFPSVPVTTAAPTNAVSPNISDAAKPGDQPSPGGLPTSPVSQPRLVGTTGLTTNGPTVIAPSLPDETPAVLPVTSTSSPPATISSSGPNARTGLVNGHVTSEPGCPVARAGNPCPALAVANRKVQIKDPTQTAIIKTVTTDSNGYFIIELAAGNYVVEVAPGANSVERRKPYPVVVVVGQSVPLEIILDSGIR